MIYLSLLLFHVFLLISLKQLITHAAPVSSVARMVVASSQLGNVTTKMIVEMDQMKKVVNILLVLKENSHVPIIVASQRHRFVNYVYMSINLNF